MPTFGYDANRLYALLCKAAMPAIGRADSAVTTPVTSVLGTSSTGGALENIEEKLVASDTNGFPNVENLSISAVLMAAIANLLYYYYNPMDTPPRYRLLYIKWHFRYRWRHTAGCLPL